MKVDGVDTIFSLAQVVVLCWENNCVSSLPKKEKNDDGIVVFFFLAKRDKRKH